MKSFGRILLVFLLVWCAARTAVFLLPGDPVDFLVHDSLVQVDPALLRSRMDLDGSPWSRLFSLPRNQSLIRSETAAVLMKSAVLHTGVLGLLSVLLAIPLTFLLLFLDFRRNGESTISAWASITLASAPVFVTGPILLWLLPIPNPILPALVLALHLTAVWHRALSARIRQLLPSSSVPGARALGFGEIRVFYKNLLAPALGTFLVFFGSQVGTLLNGSLLVEILFHWNGLGNLIAESVLSRDYPLIEIGIMVAAFFSLLAQQLGYAAQKWWDPTVK
jgi:peptide/nickel transport system permease protein